MEAFVAAVHRELRWNAPGTWFVEGFEGRVAASLAAAIEAAPEDLDDHLSILIAIEEEFSAHEDHAPAARAWSAFVDSMVARWQKSNAEAFRIARAHRDASRQRLALDGPAPKVESKNSDVKAGPLARFTLSTGSETMASPAPPRGARRTPLSNPKSPPEE